MTVRDGATKPLSVAILALGGQGGAVLTKWLVETAEACGYYAQSTSVPGVAQRTGATIYYCEFFRRSAMNGARPIMALMPAPGEVDLVVAAELVEAARATDRGFVSPDRTVLIASSHRDYAISEKAALANGIVDAEEITSYVSAASLDALLCDFKAAAVDCGAFISAVLFGAIAKAGQLPFPKSAYLETIAKGPGAAKNIEGFEVGYKMNSAPDLEDRRSNNDNVPLTVIAKSPQAEKILDRVGALPEAARAIAAEGVRQLTDYQDIRYAGLYLDRLEAVLRLERSGETAAYAYITKLLAKHLAIWMAYEDTFRVADLKTRATRFASIQKEIRAKDDQLFYPVEFMKPRVQEIADSMPAPVGRFILCSPLLKNTIKCFVSGKKISTGKIFPFLFLYALSQGRRWRQTTLRYKLENEKIENWLLLVQSLVQEDPMLAAEIIETQRLIKGYGETYERGWDKFQSIVAAVQNVVKAPDAAKLVQSLRLAALQDEEGKALKKALSTLSTGHSTS